MKGFAKIVATNAAVLLGLLILVELIFGNWVRPMSIGDLKRFSIPINIDYTYDVSGLYGDPAAPRMIQYTRDQWGLRGDFQKIGEIDVLTIGGSTTDQKFLDDRETWQSFTQKELAARGIEWTFANAGVDGQSTAGHLFNFDNWFNLLPELRPKSVLFYVGINDVMKTAARGDYDGSLDAQSWRVKSALWQIVRLVRGGKNARDAQVVHGRKQTYTEADFTTEGMLDAATREDLAKQISTRFLHNVDLLVARSQAMGARPVLVTQNAYGWNAGAGEPRGIRTPQPVRIHGREMNYADVSYLHQQLNAALLRHCQEHHLACLDLASEIELGADDYYDWLHTAPSGAAKIGAYLAPRLALLP
jgi:hypothetical protein